MLAPFRATIATTTLKHVAILCLCYNEPICLYRSVAAPSRSHMTGRSALSLIAVNVQLAVTPGSSLTPVQLVASFAGCETAIFCVNIFCMPGSSAHAACAQMCDAGLQLCGSHCGSPDILHCRNQMKFLYTFNMKHIILDWNVNADWDVLSR